MTQNPLSKFFRQPAIYIRLPSNGISWLPGTLDMPINGELPVLPMTAIDEITYRTPDALFNGEAVVSVISSCVPNIKDPWAIPSTDLDAILIAIRIASYGHNLDVESTCPNCDSENTYGLDLRNILDSLTLTDFSKPLEINDLVFYFKPLNYKEITDNSIEQFEYQKTLQVVSENNNIPEKDKINQLNSMMKNLITVTVKAMAQSIVEIRTNGAVVSDHTYIEEFIANCDRSIFNKIKEHVVTLREQSEIKPIDLTCPDCKHHYKQNFTLDMANFFGSAS